MITYADLLKRLYEHADEGYRAFHQRLLKDERIRVIGVRMPALRKIAKEYAADWREILTFPDEYYEVTFLKCTLVGALPFEAFCATVDCVVPLIDNWATCDCFHAPCIRRHREAFLPYVKRYLADEREFTARYGLVTLLHDYMDERYLPLLLESVRNADGSKYYVMTAAAWLLAEILVRFYERGVAFLREEGICDAVRGKGIQKARESLRLSKEQKDFLMKMKK